ncbi:MAG: hypothetical protein OEW93_11760 [Candidatus Bathyarchaeota archaeon]|nr:hypothetical protein [Candidatus Bathyarchaeota archaeon]
MGGEAASDGRSQVSGQADGVALEGQVEVEVGPPEQQVADAAAHQVDAKAALTGQVQQPPQCVMCGDGQALLDGI